MVKWLVDSPFTSRGEHHEHPARPLCPAARADPGDRRDGAAADRRRTRRPQRGHAHDPRRHPHRGLGLCVDGAAGRHGVPRRLRDGRFRALHQGGDPVVVGGLRADGAPFLRAGEERALRASGAHRSGDAGHVADGLGVELHRALHGAGAAEPGTLRARTPFNRDSVRSLGSGPQIFRPRLAVVGHDAVRHLADLRLHRLGRFRHHRPCDRGERRLDRADLRHRLPARRPRIQDIRGAVPHVDARCVRGLADADHRPIWRRPRKSPRSRWCCAPSSCRSPAPSISGSRSSSSSRSCRWAWRLRGDRPDQHQAADGVQLDRPYGLCAAGPGCGHRARPALRAVLSGVLFADQYRRLRLRPGDAPCRAGGREHLGPCGPRAHAPRARLRLHGDDAEPVGPAARSPASWPRRSSSSPRFRRISTCSRSSAC